jgi:hypothetical protein
MSDDDLRSLLNRVIAEAARRQMITVTIEEAPDG